MLSSLLPSYHYLDTRVALTLSPDLNMSFLRREFLSMPMDDEPTELSPLGLQAERDLSSPGRLNSVSSANSSGSQIWQWKKRKQASLNTQLLKSVESGNVQNVEKFIKRGANINATCRKTRCTALNLAALLGHEKIVSYLLDNGASVDREDIYGQNILHYLALTENMGCLKIVAKYVKSNPLTSFKNLINTQCESHALGKLEPRVCDNLEHRCEEIKKLIPKVEPGRTPLHVASWNANIIIAKNLKIHGADFNLEDKQGSLPMNLVGGIYLKADSLDSEDLTLFSTTLQFFIENNAKYKENKYNIYPLHTAIVLGHVESVISLLDYEADSSQINNDGYTAFHVAILQKREEILNILIDSWLHAHDDINLKDKNGCTPYQLAISIEWIPGISMLLASGAQITETALNGTTALHLAASKGNANFLEELLNFENVAFILNTVNDLDETPLYCAVKSDHLGCVQALLKAGADVFQKMKNNQTILHKVVECGNSEILKALVMKVNNRNFLNERETAQNMTALHTAVLNNHYYCVEILLNAGCDQKMGTYGLKYYNDLPIHLAAKFDRPGILRLLIIHDKSVVHEENSWGWTPLHIAAKNGSRQCVKILLENGADLSSRARFPCQTACCTYTAGELVMKHISRPCDFMESVFDDCIKIDGSMDINDPKCNIEIDFNILTPRIKTTEEMRVLSTIINTGNRFDQKRLLLHPLVESFLHLKWQKFSLIFKLIMTIYFFYLTLVTVVTICKFYLEDKEDVPDWVIVVREISTFLLIVLLVIALIIEIIHAYFFFLVYISQFENWLKWLSFFCSVWIIIFEFWQPPYKLWPRHIAAIGILISWMSLMFQMAHIPDWGYYVLMFFKVARNILKVLLTFSFLIIGFSLTFLIEFQSDNPFESPWQAIMKTIVMMTSEFDYASLFENEQNDNANRFMAHIIGRIIFITFIILVPIVLMNLMLGLAVSDITALEIKGKIEHLERQVDYLRCLDVIVNAHVENSETMDKMLSCKNTITISPANINNNVQLPLALKEEIIDRAMDQISKKEEISHSQLIEKIETSTNQMIAKFDELSTQVNRLFGERRQRPKRNLRHLLAKIAGVNLRENNELEDETLESITNLSDLDARLSKMENLLESFMKNK